MNFIAKWYRTPLADRKCDQVWQTSDMSKPKPRPRTARREAEREAAMQAQTRERIARLEPGGAADWPITVESAVLIERRAEAMKCIHCAGELEVKDHDAKVIGESRRRIVGAKCRRCGAARTIWFAIVEPVEN